MTRRTLPTLLALVALTAFAQDPRLEDSARTFAQEFYAWYVPIAAKGHSGRAFEVALRQKASSFSPQLLQALREDAAAQAKVSDDIVGLDFDPFLNSQEPANRFVLGQVVRKEDGYWISFHHSQASLQRGKPDAIAVATQANGHWVFSNFRFPGGGDLLGTLQALKRDREKAPR